MSNFEITINPAYEHLRDVIEGICENDLPASAVEVHNAGNRVVKITCNDNFELNIKKYKVPNMVQGAIYRATDGKACRSYLNALKLIEMGFHTPTPIAYAQEILPTSIGRSYYFSHHIDAKKLSDISGPVRREVLMALGADIARLHRAKVSMPDFSPGNILVTHNDLGHYTFNYVDLNRIKFDEPRHWVLMHSFERLTQYEPETTIIAQAYAQTLGVPENRTVAEALAVMRKYMAIKRHTDSLKMALQPWKK